MTPDATSRTPARGFRTLPAILSCLAITFGLAACGSQTHAGSSYAAASGHNQIGSATTADTSSTQPASRARKSAERRIKKDRHSAGRHHQAPVLNRPKSGGAPHPPSALVAYCQRLPPVAPLPRQMKTVTARDVALQLLPRVAALQHLLITSTGPHAAALGHSHAAAVMRADLVGLQHLIRRALTGSSDGTRAAISRAAASFTGGVRQLGLPQCQMGA